MNVPCLDKPGEGRYPNVVTKVVIQAFSLSLDFLRAHSALLSFVVVRYKYSKFPEGFKVLQIRAYKLTLFKLGIGKQLPS